MKRILTAIIDRDSLQKLQDLFAQANGIASTIVDVSGSAITEASNYCEVCSLVRTTPKGRQNCERSGRLLGKMALSTQQPYCHYCESIGFLDAAAPIVIDGVHVANWLIGQNSIGRVDEARVIAYAAEIGLEPEMLLAAFRRMDTMTEQQFRSKLDFLWLMANQLSNQAYQQLRYQEMVESLKKSQRELNDYKDNLEEIVRSRTGELEQAIRKIQEISLRDGLTGCFNRGAINKSLPKEITRARRYGNPISILLCDLDHFKNINDSYGHRAGDEVLKKVVMTITCNIRDDIDWLGRYGGEEFILVLPMVNTDGALVVAERLRQAIAAQVFTFGESQVGVTASFGVCSFADWDGETVISPDLMVSSADTYLYRAKHQGRNRVVAGSPVQG